MNNLYIPCLQVIIANRFTCGERKIWQNIEKSQNVMKLIEAYINLPILFSKVELKLGDTFSQFIHRLKIGIF